MINEFESLTGIKDTEIIDAVIIDVQKGTIIVMGNDMDIPTSTHKFTESDEWFEIRNKDGEAVLSGNIYWDEHWGFQYVENQRKDNGNITYGNDYRNPKDIFFKGNDKTPFLELGWVKTNLRKNHKMLRIGEETSLIQIRCIKYNDDDSVDSELIDLEKPTKLYENADGVGLYSSTTKGLNHIVDLSIKDIKAILVATGLQEQKDSWETTMFLVTETLSTIRNKNEATNAIMELDGMFGVFEFAKQISTQFELEYKDHEWGVNDDYIDTLDAYIEKEVKKL